MGLSMRSAGREPVRVRELPEVGKGLFGESHGIALDLVEVCLRDFEHAGDFRPIGRGSREGAYPVDLVLDGGHERAGYEALEPRLAGVLAKRLFGGGEGLVAAR